MTETAARTSDGTDGKSKRDRLIKIVGSMLDKVERASTHTRESMYQELQELKRVIEESRQELTIARPGDIKRKDIPAATDELDAVVAATAQATAEIMDSCDSIRSAASGASAEIADRINAEIMKIFESCSFQDITGQRIKKVTATLRSIEARVERLISLMGDRAAHITGDEEARTGDARFLNGPQLPEKAVSQDDIDRLLAELDGK